MTPEQVFDALSVEDRLSLLVGLGWISPQSYRDWEEQDLRFSCLRYEIAQRLVEKCWNKRSSRFDVSREDRPLPSTKRAKRK